MEALILYCDTGGGHHAAASALAEACHEAGHRATLLDPYTLFGEKTATHINSTYMKTVQQAPFVFGAAFYAGEAYRRISKHSPVYWANVAKSEVLGAHIADHNYDVIVTTHLFPGELLSALHNHGVKLPPVIFVATDYSCTPFIEELICDAYVIPHPDLISEFTRFGLPATKLHPLGIPVAKSFNQELTQLEAKKRLGLAEPKDYWLIGAGSIGGSGLSKMVARIVTCAKKYPQVEVIVLTGRDETVIQKLSVKYRDNEKVHLLAYTEQMPAYLRSCDLYFSKPGGLSSTEALVANVPLIHIAPLPGGEPHNREFFVTHGLSLQADSQNQLEVAITSFQQPTLRAMMCANQHKYAKPNAASDVVSLAQTLIDSRENTKN